MGKAPNIIKCWWGWGGTGMTGMQMYSHLGNHLSISYKLSISIWSNSLCLWHLCSWVHTKTCTQGYRSFIHDCKNWKQQRCPEVSEWMNKLWCIQTIGYYLWAQKNGLSNHEKTWRKCKYILLNERSHQKAAYNVTENDKTVCRET